MLDRPHIHVGAYTVWSAYTYITNQRLLLLCRAHHSLRVQSPCRVFPPAVIGYLCPKALSDRLGFRLQVNIYTGIPVDLCMRGGSSGLSDDLVTQA